MGKWREGAHEKGLACCLDCIRAPCKRALQLRAPCECPGPSWPPLQVVLGRLAMLAFAALVVYESLHSNRPLFSTLLYYWP